MTGVRASTKLQTCAGIRPTLGAHKTARCVFQNRAPPRPLAPHNGISRKVQAQDYMQFMSASLRSELRLKERSTLSCTIASLTRLLSIKLSSQTFTTSQMDGSTLANTTLQA